MQKLNKPSFKLSASLTFSTSFTCTGLKNFVECRLTSHTIDNFADFIPVLFYYLDSRFLSQKYRLDCGFWKKFWYGCFFFFFFLIGVLVT